MFIVIHFGGVSLMTQSLVTEKKDTLYEEAASLTEKYFFNVDTLNAFQDKQEQQLRERMDSLQTMSHARYFLADGNGRILIDSTSDSNIEGQNFKNFPGALLEKTSFIGDLENDAFPGEILAVIYPLSEDATVTGYLLIMAPMNSIRAAAVRYIATLQNCFIAFFVLLFFVMAYLCYKTYRPVYMMTKAIQEYNRGHFDHQMPKIKGGEYNELVSSIHHLATTSSETNEQQRNFIANVSHDFRSPLTSIKGYTEAIMDGTIPPEIQEKYLGIILSETKRLEKLTESLLELNRYENQGIILTYSTFDINELIKNAASVFEQRCTEKHISIQLIFSTKNLFVEADRSKISQVIQNLVDNAIKFSHTDSTIEIHTFDRAGKAFITVRDHGIGIPKESLSHIWDRFYKTDLSRGQDKTGTGLGLAIIKEIIDAHHEHLHATSIVGVGTDFSFTLRCHTASYF
jgi:signal transduction histidine kinase